ncbi:MAG: 3-carboxy-cis,cis-muconate cycloisomerase [Polaromonas sp.]|nr:3-carboxy-cis,cis-muconate cycloisomerase [Polaromonas sp.]
MSSVFESFLSTPEALDAFGERHFVGAMLRFEAALARAQASSALIPQDAARCIIDCCTIDRFDVAGLVAGSGRAGSLAIPLVKSLRQVVRAESQHAAGFVHLGATSQDVIDTALALVLQHALGAFRADVHRAAQALLVLAQRHAADPMLARTLMQPASVTSFGLKCAAWGAPLVRGLQRLQTRALPALSVQLGGAVGTLAQMAGQGPKIRAAMAVDLGLNDPGCSWHTQRDDWAALACEVGVLVGSLGKIAKDISLMSQFEVSELAEPAEEGRGGSSAMPHKRNPVACMTALAAAQRAPHRVAAILAAMPQEHERALGNWQAELAEWPGLMMSAQGAARAMGLALQGLQVDARRMLANVESVRAVLPADAAKEWFDVAFSTLASEQARAMVVSQTAALAALASA